MATLSSKYKGGTKPQATAIQSISEMLSRFAWFRDEAIKREELQMELKVAQGTATFDDEINLYKKQAKWFDRFSSRYAELQNTINSLNEQKEEADIQFKYKTRQIDDNELLAIRQEQLAKTVDGSIKNYQLKSEIDDIQRRIQQRADNQQIANAILLYKNNFASSQQQLDFLQSKYDEMVASGKYTTDELFEVNQQLEQQKIDNIDLANEAAKVNSEMAMQNGVDRASSLQTYVSDLQTQYNAERDPIEKIRIQGRLVAAQEEYRQVTRDRDEMNYRIQYAKQELSNTEFSQKLFELADSEIDPDKKLEYQLEASKVKKQATDETFSKDVQKIKNQFEKDQDNNKVLAAYEDLRAKYATDDEIQFEIDSLVASQERDVKNKNFEDAVQRFKDEFAKNKNSATYLNNLRSLESTYSDDLLLGSKLRTLIAQQTGDVNDEKFNIAVQNIVNKFNAKEITEAEYISQMNALKSKPEFAEFINSPQYKSEMDRIISTQQGNIKEQAFTNEITRLANLRSNYSITDEQYLSALNNIKNNPDFSDILRFSQYSVKLDNVISGTEGDISDTKFSNQVNDLKNKFNAKQITQKQYLDSVNSLKKDYATNPTYVNKLEGISAQLTGNEKDLNFSNSLSNLNNQYKSGAINTTQYLNKLKTEQSKYAKGGPEDEYYRKIEDIIAPIQLKQVKETYDKELINAENKYTKNKTNAGLTAYLADIQSLKNKYSNYTDITNELLSKEAILQGNVAEATFYKELSDLQTQLSEGKFESPNNDFGTSTYLNKLKDLQNKYFGEGSTIKLSQDISDKLNNELIGGQGSQTRVQQERKLQNLSDEYATGKIDANAYRAELNRLKNANSFGTSLDVRQLFDDDIYRVETDLAQKNYESYISDLTKQRESVITEQQKRFARAEQEFKNISSEYSAGRTSFENYQSAQNKLATQTQQYTDWKNTVQGDEYKLPEFKFEQFKPDTNLDKPKYKLPELFNF